MNKQPWRVVMEGDKIHFFEKRLLKVDSGNMDMQRIDVGIGICHFHLAAMEQGINGHFERCAPRMETPKDVVYIVSWVRE